jgi:hypothetical protein
MDLISTAIIGALTFTGPEVAKAAIKDLYDQLKLIIFSKTSGQKGVQTAIAGLEEDPESLGFRGVVAEKILQGQLSNDVLIVSLAEKINILIHAQAKHSDNSQIATGNYIAQASSGGTASVNVGKVEREDE